MKAILISIKPKWVAKILNGEKTIEIRKTCPAIFKHLHSYEGASLEVYIYCTKGNPIGKFGDGLYHEITEDSHWSNGCSWNMPKIYLEGKVVAKFTLNKVEEIMLINCVFINKKRLLAQSCLDERELWHYLAPQNAFVRNCGYAWHISNLEIFDKPKELSEFRAYKPNACEKCWCVDNEDCLLNKNCPKHRKLTKAPQSWCYVEVK